MTRESLFDWLKVHDCYIEINDGINTRHNLNCVKIVNPKTGTHAILSTPIDDTELIGPVVETICTRLGVELPDCAIHAKDIMDQIRKELKLK